MITRVCNLVACINNAGARRLPFCTLPNSRSTRACLDFLLEHKCIKGFTVAPGVKGDVRVWLRYVGELPFIKQLKRISRPAQPVHMTVQDISKLPFYGGLVAFSTSRGLMDCRQCLKDRTGGLGLFYVHRNFKVRTLGTT